MADNNYAEHKRDKAVFKKGKHKRLSDAAHMNLSHITESDEIQKYLKMNQETIEEGDSVNSYENDSFESDSRGDGNSEKEAKATKKLIEIDEKTKVNKTKDGRTIEDLKDRKVHHGYEPECEKISEEEIKTTEVREMIQVDQVNKMQGNKSRTDCEKSINKKSSTNELKLDLSKLSSETDSSSEMDIPDLNGKKNKSVGDSPKNFNDLNAFPALKHTCNHGAIDYTQSKGEASFQNASQGQKSDKTPRKCILCDINGASVRTRAIQTDADKLLSELIYPYEFYDRFSRADKRQNEEKTKEVIPICQPAKVVQRPTTPMRMTPVIPVPGVPVPEIPVPVPILKISDKESAKGSPRKVPNPSPLETGEVERERRKEKKAKRVEYLYEPRENFKTEFHEHCGSTLNALIVSEHTDGQKRTLQGMKGYFQQQRDGKTSPKAVKQSEYTINSLGIQFTIPEYNTSLRSRKEPTSTPRPPTQQTIFSPRFNEQYLPLSRPPTFRQSPRHTLLTSNPRDMFTPIQQPIAPVPSVEDIVKSFDTHRSRMSEPFNIKTSGKTTTSSRKEKLRINPEDLQRRPHKALPPIPTGVRQGPRGQSTLTTGPIPVGGFTL